ncbi:MAG: FeoA family protein [Clostridium sp.]|uniref:FeoA family protein n=1 Tax=Clostridium culturomicium TaxID=1499683 RepID=UPI0005A5DFBA|nr:FeoA family protein [Clostridium culturomicium]MDU4889181.1 FeoA family protein [Clostridium sp.]MDU7083175.1 FeoA family protein [Clostridium sp.]
MINEINKYNKIESLDSLPLGGRCRVQYLASDGNIRRRMLDLGIIKDTEIAALTKSPSGDPVAYLIRGAVIAIRKEDAALIFIETI